MSEAGEMIVDYILKLFGSKFIEFREIALDPVVHPIFKSEIEVILIILCMLSLIMSVYLAISAPFEWVTVR